MQNLRSLTNDEILNFAEAVPSYTDNAELVAELARRLDVLERQIQSYQKLEASINEAQNMGSGVYIP